MQIITQLYFFSVFLEMANSRDCILFSAETLAFEYLLFFHAAIALQIPDYKTIWFFFVEALGGLIKTQFTAKSCVFLIPDEFL